MSGDLVPPLGNRDIPDESRGWSTVLQTVFKQLWRRAKRADVLIDEPDIAGTAVAPVLPTTASPDATAAGAGYVQTQAQSVVVLANELKADLNALVTALNAYFAADLADAAAARTAINQILSALRDRPVS